MVTRELSLLTITNIKCQKDALVITQDIVSSFKNGKFKGTSKTDRLGVVGFVNIRLHSFCQMLTPPSYISHFTFWLHPCAHKSKQ